MPATKGTGSGGTSSSSKSTRMSSTCLVSGLGLVFLVLSCAAGVSQPWKALTLAQAQECFVQPGEHVAKAEKLEVKEDKATEEEKAFAAFIQGPKALIEQRRPFFHWLRDNGFTPNSSEVLLAYIDDESGFGILAQKDFHEGDKVVCVPESIVWRAQNKHSDEHVSHAHELLDHLGKETPKHKDTTDSLKIVLALALDATHPKSFWAPFMASWPDPIDPSVWKPQEVNELQNIEVAAEVDYFVRASDAGWHHYGEVFKQAHAGRINDDVFHWARQQISHRAFLLDTEAGMVPYIDMFNSELLWDPYARGYKQFRSYNFTAGVGFCLYAHRDFRNGEQIMATYQPLHTSSEWLLQYGFVVDSALNDLVEFRIATVKAPTPDYFTDDAPTLSSFYLKLSDVVVPELFIRTLLVSYMNEAELAEAGLDEARIMSQENVKMALGWVSDSIEEHLTPFTTLRKDQSLLKNAKKKELSLNMITAIKFRMQMKKSLGYVSDRLLDDPIIESRYAAPKELPTSFPLARIRVKRPEPK